MNISHKKYLFLHKNEKKKIENRRKNSMGSAEERAEKQHFVHCHSLLSSQLL